MSLLAIEGLDAGYGLLTAVRQVSFALREGEVLALVGANGAGKTTLLRAIAGAHRPTSGSIRLNGADVTRSPAHTRTAMGIALVPEGRRLFPGMTVEENLRVAGAVGRRGPWQLDTVIDAFPILKKRLKARAGSLSGGEQQAAAIGRALMTNPLLLLLDEVSLGLAPIVVEQVYHSLASLIGSGTTIVLVEQDLARALGVATHVACMLEGSIVLEGKTEAVTREQVTAAYFGLGRSDGAHLAS
jgi:branched-chain amino acid transport system ATP-binding protein